MTEATNQNEAGRAVVRKVFVDPITTAGLMRPKGMSAAGFDKGLDRLITELDHMSADNLATLAESVIRHSIQEAAKTKDKDCCVWPSFIVIQSWGHGLQPRPFKLSRIVTSWLASVEGPVAIAGGYEVQLLRFLRRNQCPPTPYDIGQMKLQASEDQRLMGLIKDRIARDRVSDLDRQWHSAYLADQAQAAAYIDQGEAARQSAVEGAAA